MNLAVAIFIGLYVPDEPFQDDKISAIRLRQKSVARHHPFMKFFVTIVIIFHFASCLTERRMPDRLPNSGLWTNYKYPLYLRDTRSARFVQDQIYITTVEIREGDTLIWLQFRLRDWHGFQPIDLGNKKWLLKNDSLNLTIPMEIMARNNGLILAYDMFLPVNGENMEDTAIAFYLGDYEIGKKRVKILKNGEVINLDSFVEFRPVLDYSMEPGEGDRIWLKSESGHWTKFGLTVSHWDRLEIYKLNGDTLGEKIFALKRTLKPLYLD